MATTQLPREWKEFLRLLNSTSVEYLIIGGFAVGHYGYPRATGDIDVWLAYTPQNLARAAAALRAFGFTVPEPSEAFLGANEMFGMGSPPLRIELLTGISGVRFEECYGNRVMVEIDGVTVPMIPLAQLRANKTASGRLKDLDDLQNLPG